MTEPVPNANVLLLRKTLPWRSKCYFLDFITNQLQGSWTAEQKSKMQTACNLVFSLDQEIGQPHSQDRLEVVLFIYLFICLFIYLFIYVCIYVFIYLFIYLFIQRNILQNAIGRDTTRVKHQNIQMSVKNEAKLCLITTCNGAGQTARLITFNADRFP